MADDGDLVANFLAITGCADDAAAVQWLEAANFSLEDAVNLYFAADGNLGGHGGGAGGTAGGGAGGAGAGRSNSPPRDHAMDDDNIRAPLPTKVERLYGDDFDPRGLSHLHHLAQHGLAGRAPPSSAAHIDVFRDFRQETQQAQQAAMAAASGAAIGAAAAGAAAAGAAGAPSDISAQAQGLSGLFKLPADLHFSGTAEMAKQRAAAEGKWLLINVQSATEFASHRLNRDTWSHEALKDVLKHMFVFYQVYDSTPDGRTLTKAYRLDSGPAPHLPVVLVVDPITGAKLWARIGFVDAEKLMEELVPFMDHGPLDAGAASLAQSNMLRKAAAPPPAAAGGSGAAASRGPMTEDEELALALAMSMDREGGAGGAGDAGAGDGGSSGGQDGEAEGGDDDLDEAAIWEQIKEAERQRAEESARKSPEEVAAEARARVPPEPAEGEPGAVRVALRLPDGRRLMRRFLASHTLAALADLCTAEVPEAAAGRGLVLAFAQPGAQPLSDMGQTLQEAGVAGAMLNVKLAD